MPYKDVTPPAGGKVTIANGKLNVPENPILPFIRGDGTGPDIWAASQRVFDAAVQKAYGGRRKIAWMEVFAGEKRRHGPLHVRCQPAERDARDDVVSLRSPGIRLGQRDGQEHEGNDEDDAAKHGREHNRP